MAKNNAKVRAANRFAICIYLTFRFSIFLTQRTFPFVAIKSAFDRRTSSSLFRTPKKITAPHN
jgi:hypothetical protein